MGARGVAMARAGVISGARVDDGGSLAGPWRVVWRTPAGRWVDVFGSVLDAELLRGHRRAPRCPLASGRSRCARRWTSAHADAR